MREPPARPGADIRPLRADRDSAALADLRNRAFGPLPADPAWRADIEPAMRGQRYLGAFDGPRLLAAGRFHDMTQFWHGRAVPMAGVASVAVAPEDRGRGLGRALTSALLEAIGARGYPLSALFPSTLPLYRSLGWEVAGTSHEARFAAAALRSLAAPPEPAPPGDAVGRVSGQVNAVRRAGPADAAVVREVLGRVHATARDSGPTLRDEETTRRALADPDRYYYLAADGVLVCGWRHGHDELLVRMAVAASEPATRALWAVVASHCWVADTVRARVGPADPVWWLTRDPVADAVDHDDWMLRVVDPAAAIAARGFPAAATLSAWLRLTDDARPANSGLWRLEVSNGQGSLARVLEPADQVPSGPAPGGPDPGREPLALGARGLAALYAGTPVATLRRVGLAAGSDSGDARLDGAFGAAPYTLDRF